MMTTTRKRTRRVTKPKPEVAPESVQVTSVSEGKAMDAALREETGVGLQDVARQLGVREENVANLDLDELARRVASILKAEQTDPDSKVSVKEAVAQHIRYDYVDLKTPGKHVRLERNREKNIQRAQALGYSFVDPAEVKDRDTLRTFVGSDNLVHAGDRVAMACPQEMYDGREKARLDETLNQPRAVEAANEAAAQDGKPGAGLHKYDEHGHGKGKRIFPMQ